MQGDENIFAFERSLPYILVKTRLFPGIHVAMFEDISLFEGTS